MFPSFQYSGILNWNAAIPQGTVDGSRSATWFLKAIVRHAVCAFESHREKGKKKSKRAKHLVGSWRGVWHEALPSPECEMYVNCSSNAANARHRHIIITSGVGWVAALDDDG